MYLGAALVAASAYHGAGAEQAPRVIAVEASRFRFEPAEIRVEPGERVILELSSADRLHGFHLPAIGVRADILPGEKVRVPVQVDEAGEYRFLCDVFCGSGHEGMTGRLVVQAPTHSRAAD